jgi:hypothetical protein
LTNILVNRHMKPLDVPSKFNVHEEMCQIMPCSFFVGVRGRMYNNGKKADKLTCKK